ncbi:MAG: hypothetical protein ACE5FB_03445 [Candidatus Binatia bacterium]
MNTRQIIISAERAHHPTPQPSAGYILAQDEDRSCLESRRPAQITTAPLMLTSSIAAISPPYIVRRRFTGSDALLISRQKRMQVLEAPVAQDHVPKDKHCKEEARTWRIDERPTE